VQRVRNKTGHKIYCIFGGNRSGKTQGGAICVSKVATEVPESRILLSTVETKISINVQQKAVFEWLPESTIQNGDYNVMRGWRNIVIVGKNGYNILIKTYAQGFEAFQGDQYDLVWLDEECPYDIFQECLMRTTDRDGCILITFTSLQGFTRLVNRLWESDDPNVYTTILDLYLNPYIPKESKDLLMASIDPDEVESRIHGKPHLKEGLIYKEFGAVHKIPRFDYLSLLAEDSHRWEIHEAIDPHERTPHHWLRFLYDRSNKVVYVVEELKAPQESMLIIDFAKLIKSQKMEHKGITYRPAFTQIYTSSMRPEVSQARPDEGQEDIHTIRLAFFKAGIQTTLVSKDNAMGINEVKNRLKVLRDAQGKIVTKPSLMVFDDCKGTLWEFMRYSWDSYLSSGASERNELMNKPQKKDDHYMDLIKYECIKLANENKSVVNLVDRYVVRNPDIGY
jgi:phage terminase large subunit-like protein